MFSCGIVVAKRHRTLRHLISSYASLPTAGVSPLTTSVSARVVDAQISADDVLQVKIKIPGNQETLIRSLNTSWLRHNCPSIIDEHSGQKLAVDPAVYAPPCSAANVAVGADGMSLKVKWASDNFVSEYDGSWIAQYAIPTLELPGGAMLETPVAENSSDDSAAAATFVKSSPSPDLKRIPWETVVGSDQGLLQWLAELQSTGSCMITGAPKENGTVILLADKISRPQPTIYGAGMFDVISVAEPINIAYSPAALALHQDLVYYESPPGLQLLHCIDFASDVSGGESTLLDAAPMLDDFREKYPKYFKTLCTVPAKFQKIHYKRDEPVHMTYHRSIVSVNAWGAVTQFTWAPPFEGILPNYGVNTIAAYYAAYCALAATIESNPQTLQFKLNPGDIITFNNRRTLHGRQAFSASTGHTPRRHLQGVYVNIDDFKNKYQVLKHLSDTGPLSACQVWNQDQI